MLRNNESMRNVTSKLIRAYNERIGLNQKAKPLGNYRKTVDTADYSIYECSFAGKHVIAAYGDQVVVQSQMDKQSIFYFPYCNNRFYRFHIRLNRKNFPGLIEGSSILKCMLIPYMRKISGIQYERAIRLVIITDKSQIYHNYPARNMDYDGYSLFGDIRRFEESVVWDIPGRKHPSDDNKCEGYEIYYPNLPKECYELHPMPNTDNRFTDSYGNGGFGKFNEVKHEGQITKVSRFYIHSRDVQSNPFHFIGTGERDYKMSFICTYRSNVDKGVRICVFASSDGGRVWYCKYEFGDLGEYAFRQGNVKKWGYNFGNAILFGDYSEDDWKRVKVVKRSIIVPCDRNKEPENIFAWDEVGTVDGCEPTDENHFVLRCEEKHNLCTGNIIALASDYQTETEKNNSWMINNDYSSKSAGTGVLFKIKVLDDFRLELYEFVSSPNNNITCRHIHHINRVKDGWILGTGEIYPNSWILYIQIKKSDTYSPVYAHDELAIFRLNGSEKSIQRTMGMIYKDDYKQTVFYASDHDDLNDIPKLSFPGRTVKFSRNNTGVYVGSITDIDNRDSYQCLLNASEPCFYFQELDSAMFFCGQRGEFCISFDKGIQWKKERLSIPIIHYYGNTGQYYYFDACVFVRKR